jgi:hypothetical protein
MDRRLLILSAIASLAAPAALAQQTPDGDYAPPPPQGGPQYGPPPPPNPPQSSYDEDEITHRVSDFFGVATESAAGVVEKSFKEQGRPTGYIAGEEASAAFIGGVRYGKGLLYMKGRPAMKVYWQGPSIGFDAGANGSRVFVLCYNLEYPDAIFRRFPGVDGSVYFIGGLGMNYQRADQITLAPIRTGLGLRLGANVGYLAYSRQRNIIPF